VIKYFFITAQKFKFRATQNSYRNGALYFRAQLISGPSWRATSCL